MPLHQLAVCPADVSGSGLGLALNAPIPAALATLELVHPHGGRLTLGVLGASHVISVSDSESTFSEEISCTARSAGGALPPAVQAPGYQLESESEEHDDVRFREIALWLRQRCATEPGWLGGTFPGDDAALTALVAEPEGAGWRWRTWHLYPSADGGTVVRTNSRWYP